GPDGVELPVVGEGLPRPVDRRQPDGVAGVAQPRVNLLRAVEAVEVLEDRSDGSALSGGAGHGSIAAGRHGNVCGWVGRQEVAVFAVTRLRAGDDGQELAAAVAELLAALARRPGFRDGELGRPADGPAPGALAP